MQYVFDYALNLFELPEISKKLCDNCVKNVTKSILGVECSKSVWLPEQQVYRSGE